MFGNSVPFDGDMNIFSGNLPGRMVAVAGRNAAPVGGIGIRSCFLDFVAFYIKMIGFHEYCAVINRSGLGPKIHFQSVAD